MLKPSTLLITSTILLVTATLSTIAAANSQENLLENQQSSMKRVASTSGISSLMGGSLSNIYTNVYKTMVSNFDEPLSYGLKRHVTKLYL